jgi:DNA-binding transcriptional regulator YiaG
LSEAAASALNQRVSVRLSVRTTADSRLPPARRNNSTILPVPLSKMPCLDDPVYTVIEVRERATTPHGLSAKALKQIRAKMQISAATLAEMLLLGKGGDRTIRRWESGSGGIPGPAQVAIQLLWQQYRR